MSTEPVAALDPARASRIVWRARRIAARRWARGHRRAIAIVHGAALTATAFATPLYLNIVGLQWRRGGGDMMRAQPANIEAVLSWALTATVGGALVAAVLAAIIVAVGLWRQRHLPTERWHLVPAAAARAMLAGWVWAAASVITTTVIVNALVMT